MTGHVVVIGAGVAGLAAAGALADRRGRLLHRYLSRVYRVAEHDAVVATAFVRVINLLDTPDRLVAPAVRKRVFRRLPRDRAAA